MRIFDTLSLSTRMFQTRPLRTFLTILGVGVGIGTVLFLVSLGYGLQESILQRIATADSLLALDVGAGPVEELLLTEENIRRIQQSDSVAEIARLKNFSAQVSYGQITTNTMASAVDHSYFRMQGALVQHGALYTENEKNVAVISSAAAALFNKTPQEIVGERIHLTLLIPDPEDEAYVIVIDQGEPFTVTGVVDDENVSYVYVPLSDLSNVESQPYDMLKVKVKESALMEETRTALINQGFVVSALSDIIDQANRIFGIIQIVLALFGLVALVVSAIGMFNTMTITLLERTSEIGIMRAIGIRRRDVFGLFLVESMLMGLLGGLGGVMIGVVAGWVTNLGVNVLARRFGGTSIDIFEVPLWFVVVILAFSTSIGLATGLYPSYRASKLNPLDALRNK